MNFNDTIIKIENVTKTFGDFTAINNISLNIPKGSFTTLLGPSGCGKTTLMRMIAGFHEPDNGFIFINGNNVNGLPPYKRNTPLVFQEYALFPHMTVYDNIAYGLKLKKLPKDEINNKVKEMVHIFGLEGMEERFPRQLSGGQQQRVAFARALVIGQKILMLDEPLSNLDAKLRVEVRNELRGIQKRLGITTIFVTHDQDEALAMSDFIAVFDKGTIKQFGTPWEVYFKPNSRYVADFVGVANFIEGRVKEIQGEDIIVDYKDISIRLNERAYKVTLGEKITLLVRPECISILSEPTIDDNKINALQGQIETSSFLGHLIRYWVKVGEKTFIVDDSNPSIHGYMEGNVKLTLDKSKIHILPKNM